MTRSKVLERRNEGNQTGLVLSCGHTIYVRTFGRYRDAKTLTCPACVTTPGEKRDAEENR